MQTLLLKILSPLLFTWNVLTPAPPPSAQAVAAAQGPPMVRRVIPERLRNRTFQVARTELYFGTATPDGAVTEAQFLAFVDSEVAPRFPHGFTVLRAHGQFTGDNGVLVKEDSFVLVLLYPLESLKESNRKIEAIRVVYKRDFRQESVLRIDDQVTIRASF